MPREVHVTNPISISEVREYLLERAKEARVKKEEISYMQGIALEHSMIASRISAKDAEEIINYLIEEHRISNMGAISVANSMPDTLDELRQILDPDSKKMNTDILEQIVDKLNNYTRLESKTQVDYFEEDFLDDLEDDKELPDKLPEDLLD